MPQIFLDMDGVLADFDQHYENVFGIRPNKKVDNVDWQAVRNRANFYFDMPPMPDAFTLWEYTKRYKPIILTGIPSSVEEAEANKRSWVERHLGHDVEVRCCASKSKFAHAKPGDILVDDWEKYKHLWVGAGGVWITHTSAKRSIEELRHWGF